MYGGVSGGNINLDSISRSYRPRSYKCITVLYGSNINLAGTVRAFHRSLRETEVRTRTYNAATLPFVGNCVFRRTAPREGVGIQ